MIDGLSQLIGWVMTACQFLFNTVASFLVAVNAILDAMNLPLFLAGIMPAFVGASVTIFLGVYIIKFLIGR